MINDKFRKTVYFILNPINTATYHQKILSDSSGILKNKEVKPLSDTPKIHELKPTQNSAFKWIVDYNFKKEQTRLNISDDPSKW